MKQEFVYSRAVDFDSLPAEARLPLPVVCSLYSVGPATVWRRVKSGLIPAPIKEGGSTRWIVGDLRDALARPEKPAASTSNEWKSPAEDMPARGRAVLVCSAQGGEVRFLLATYEADKQWHYSIPGRTREKTGVCSVHLWLDGLLPPLPDGLEC